VQSQWQGPLSVCASTKAETVQRANTRAPAERPQLNLKGGAMVGTRYFPREEYQRRWQRVEAAMRERGLDLAVVWSRSAGTYDRCADLLYLANYYGNQPGQGRRGPAGFAALMLAPGATPELFADIHDPRAELIATDRFRGYADTVDAVGRALHGLGKRRVALVGSDILPMKYWAQLRALAPDIEWVIEDQLVAAVRLIKSARELDAFRIAGDTVSRALGAAMEALIAGSSEADAAGEAAKIVFAGGGHVHMLPISHGEQLRYLASDPLAGFSRARPQRGDLVRAWVTGPMFQGYWLGPGRSAVCGGSANAAQRELLEANARAVEAIVAAIRPGKTVRDLVAVGDREAAAFGGDASELSKQWPLYGHGNGLFFEGPTLSTKVGNDADFVLRENMVISVEVFFSRAGVGSTGFENNVIVTATGTELLSTTPMFW
jgi:Xaa-Pro dipeptidase